MKKEIHRLQFKDKETGEWCLSGIMDKATVKMLNEGFRGESFIIIDKEYQVCKYCSLMSNRRCGLDGGVVGLFDGCNYFSVEEI